ncbi:hypothetical protein M427DRAFT_40271 [Gonapodya prolifera JEL478]|uniref:Spondin-like TSP1 domain-containing protein n=1 Tax=Gonapodya prolifera (strain JEL478) TaxID=1344416 RepID=A0A139B055_GONPJ|nr:hypothetical protein M427DRAFT_40271 [Gonapodya prolifera JEL478]|eukprot:KXS22376.1 hypothetical protein M427DRAFT_40271 [Gonapodya prolifera JEL478]
MDAVCQSSTAPIVDLYSCDFTFPSTTTGATYPSAEFRLNSFIPGAQTSPSIASIPGKPGQFIATWASGGQDGSGGGVYAQAFDIGAAISSIPTPIGSEFKVNTVTEGDQLYPSVGVLPTFPILVAYESLVTNASSLSSTLRDRKILAQRISSSYALIGPELTISSNSLTNFSPRVVPLASLSGPLADCFAVIYIVWDHSTGRRNVLSRVLWANNGTFRTPEFAISPSSLPLSTTTVSAAPLANFGDTFAVVWSAMVNGVDTLFAQIVSADGKLIGTEFTITDPAALTNRQTESAVVSLRNGGVVVPFTAVDGRTTSQVPGSRVDVQVFDKFRARVSTTFRTSQLGGATTIQPTGVQVSSGALLVGYAGAALSQSLVDYNIFVTAADPSTGNVRSDTILVTTTNNGSQSQPAMTVVTRGSIEYVVVAWSSQGQDPDGSTGIYGRLMRCRRPIDCAVSAWSAWSTCSQPCNTGTQTRIRTVVTQASDGGAACPSLLESRTCGSTRCDGCDACSVDKCYIFLEGKYTFDGAVAACTALKANASVASGQNFCRRRTSFIVM